MPDGIPPLTDPDNPVPTVPTLREVPTPTGGKRPADMTEIVEDADGTRRMRLHFHAGQYRAWQSEARFVAIIAGSQALAIDTPILTPNGFVQMNDIHLGMEVFDDQGRRCRVIDESPIFVERECWRIIFDDGESIVADSEHLWEVTEWIAGEGWRSEILTTAQIKDRGRRSGLGIWPHAEIEWDGDLPKEYVDYEYDRRGIVEVVPAPSVPVKCIGVDSESYLYLCGYGCIPTHNSGKTVFGPVWLWREMQRNGPGDYLVVTPTYQMLELKALPALVRFFDSQMGFGKYVGTPTRRFVFTEEGERRLFGTYDPANPTKILFGYAEDPESLESMTAKAAWLDEAGQKKFKLGSWLAVNRRLAINQGRALLTTTPYDFGWLKQKVFDPYEAGDKTYEVINFKSTENPAFSQAEYDRAKATMPEWQFDLFYNGLFRRPAGLIYGCFTRGKNTCARFMIPLMWDRILGLDFGGVNTAAVFLAEEPFTNKMYLYRLYKAGGRTAIEHCLHIQQGEPEFRLVVGGSRGEGQWRQEFRVGGTIDGVAIPGLLVRKPLIADVELGITRVYGAFKRFEIIVFDDLEPIMEELESYSREVDANGDPTGEIDDKSAYHYLDSLRYPVSTVRGPHYEAELPVTSEKRSVQTAEERAKDEKARLDTIETRKMQAKIEADARRDEAERGDKARQRDIMDPSWGWG